MKKRSFLTVLLCMAALGLVAQEHFPQYRNPLDIPIYLSATFAE